MTSSGKSSTRISENPGKKSRGFSLDPAWKFFCLIIEENYTVHSMI